MPAMLGRMMRRMPDHFVRPTGHDLVFQKFVMESDPAQRLLNIGAGEYRPIRLPNVISLDITPGRNVHVVGDAHDLPFATGSFSGIVCRAVLEHVRYPTRVVGEMFRVLAPGGFVLVSVPFIYPYHAHPHDYQRFTASGLRVLFQQFEEVECGIGRLPTAALLSVLENYAAIFSDNRAVSAMLRWSVAWLLNPLKYLDYYLKRKAKANLLSSYFFLGRKPAGVAR